MEMNEEPSVQKVKSDSYDFGCCKGQTLCWNAQHLFAFLDNRETKLGPR